MFSRRIASRVSTTSPGIFRIEPRSLRRFGISPSKPALRQARIQLRIVVTATLRRPDPGIVTSRLDCRFRYGPTSAGGRCRASEIRP